MSSTIEAILPHHLVSFEEIEQLPKGLGPVLKALFTLEKAYSQSDRTDFSSLTGAWHLVSWSRPDSGLTPRQEWEAGKGPRIIAPEPMPECAATWLVFGKKCLFVTTPIKWPAALARPALFEDATQYLRALASVLGSEAFILYRSTTGAGWHWVLDGLSLEEIQQRFRKGGSKPAASLDALPSSSMKSERTRHYFEHAQGLRSP